MKALGKILGRRGRPSAKPTPANRRRERPSGDGTSDAGMRDGEAKGRGRKVLAFGAKVMLAFAAAAACLGVGMAAYGHATSSTYFAVTSLEVRGARLLEKGAVLEAAGIKEGVNIFAVKASEVERRLAGEPWIAEARVKRRLPRSVTIEVVERRAVATAIFDVPYLVDDVGRVFKRWAPGDPAPAPFVTGFAREELADDEPGVTTEMRDAISLATRYREAGLERIAPLGEVHREVDGGFSLTVGEDATYIRFGHGPYRVKLARLVTLLARMRADGERPAVVFLDNRVRPDRVTVKMKRDEKPIETAQGSADGVDAKKTVSKI
ncbi:MAG: FtsQ-type POTRA domain-containing protein [Deltaproteobacteria bacterium]|nr:FtsQ-type POTRA domain-containing protein [Deltaproteobacteria bacterium]